jgi:hypothetical protein
MRDEETYAKRDRMHRITPSVPVMMILEAGPDPNSALPLLCYLIYFEVVL